MNSGALNKGMVIDARVGESIVLHPSENSRVVLTIEAKHGQRSRVRVQSSAPLRIDPPKKETEISREAVAEAP